MSSRSRRAFGAAGGCIAAATLVGATLSYGAPPHNEGNRQPVEANAAGTQDKPDQSGSADKAKRTPYAVDYERACSKPTDKDEADLCQQWRNAEAASELVEQSRLQFALSIAESALLAITVFFTGWAAIAAAKAARAAQTSTEIAIRQEQPMLYVKSFSYEKLNAIIVVRNAGGSSAIVTRYSINSQLVEELPDKPIYTHKAYARREMRPQTDESLSLRVLSGARSLADSEDLAKGKKRLWIYGFIVYEDGDKAFWQTGFCLDIYSGIRGYGPEHYTYKRRVAGGSGDEPEDEVPRHPTSIK